MCASEGKRAKLREMMALRKATRLTCAGCGESVAADNVTLLYERGWRVVDGKPLCPQHYDLLAAARVLMGSVMKYKPRQSNFDEVQDEIIDELSSAHEHTENAKDTIARVIDEYVEAILKEHVEEVDVGVWPGHKSPLVVRFSAGEKSLPDGTIDMFAHEESLGTILADFDMWNELSEFEDPQPVRQLADCMEKFATKLREVADGIEKENRLYAEVRSNE